MAFRGNKGSSDIIQVKDFDDLKIYAYKNQDYEKLKRECLARRVLFEDPLFPAKDSSVYNFQSVPYGMKWKRPHEIVKSPLFIDGTLSADDLDQGQLGNCWFISGCSAVATVPELINKVVPPNQECSGKDYAGIFHFRFWLYGRWNDVVIDDRLPVTPDNRLIFCRCAESPNEFWAALLEKAYAKVCLSYENLDGGQTTDALIDMSGGIEESFQIASMRTVKQKDLIWDIVVKSRQHKSPIGASIDPDPRIREARLSNGLVKGHAYSVTKVACIEKNGREVQLIRIRNPWGTDFEWKGAWSDRSYDWQGVSDELKKQLEYDEMPDGEYWMSFEDFYRNFDCIEICSLTPDAFSDELEGNHPELHLKWKAVAYDCAWIAGESAGGSGQYDREKYWTNPQVLVTLTDVDPYDKENMATIIVSLLQKNTREKRIQNNGEPAEQFIQFRLYRIRNPNDAAKAKNGGQRLYSSQLELAGTSGTYINARDMTKRFRVPPGDYVIIPSCFEADVEGEFLLRVFTEQELDSSTYKVLDQHKPELTESDKNPNVNISQISFWNDFLHNNFNSSAWNSPYTSKIVRSKNLFQFTSPHRTDIDVTYEKKKNLENQSARKLVFKVKEEKSSILDYNLCEFKYHESFFYYYS